MEQEINRKASEGQKALEELRKQEKVAKTEGDRESSYCHCRSGTAVSLYQREYCTYKNEELVKVLKRKNRKVW